MTDGEAALSLLPRVAAVLKEARETIKLARNYVDDEGGNLALLSERIYELEVDIAEFTKK